MSSLQSGTVTFIRIITLIIFTSWKYTTLLELKYFVSLQSFRVLFLPDQLKILMANNYNTWSLEHVH